MSKEFRQMKKRMIAGKMRKMDYRIRTNSKSLSKDSWSQRFDKKKLPNIPIPKSGKDPAYAKMSIEDFLKKYPEWRV